jgi:acetyl-CoA synthetase
MGISIESRHRTQNGIVKPMAQVWRPTAEYIERTNAYRFLRKLGFTNLGDFLAWSAARPEEFWPAILNETGVQFSTPYVQVLDESSGPAHADWFVGGELNIAANCLDRHVGRSNPAIVFEAESGQTRTLSFADLADLTNRIANTLLGHQLSPGDRVALVVPMVPETAAILYACAKLGLIAVPIFAGFGAGAIAQRLADCGAKLVFTARTLTRRGKQQPLAEKIPAEYPLILIGETEYPDRTPVASQPLPAMTPVLLLYTSGTTGTPKGVIHTHAGALAQTGKEIYLAFDHQATDVFFWLTDIGWMMGPWTILGNHLLGGTIFLYDGAPDFPEPDRIWQLIERHGVTTFGISPTAIRQWSRNPAPLPAMSSLRILGSTGEPWDQESWLWFFEHVGRKRCPIINISGGTEILGCFLFPLPMTPTKPCSLGGPAPGMATGIIDGHLVCTAPAPSMTRSLWNAEERYLETYWSKFPGIWNHGDWASTDEDGEWFLHGRADESMNVAGRKVGPAEIEQALLSHPAVREAAAIGVPDAVKGEAIVVYAVLTGEAQPLALAAHIADYMGPAFRPREVIVLAELPKTQSGKILRAQLRRGYLEKCQAAG